MPIAIKKIAFKIAKWVGIVLGSVIVIAIGISAFVYIQFERDLNRTYTVAESNLQIPAPDSLILARGKRVVELHHCNGCHTESLKGHTFEMPDYFGALSPANLTSGKGGIGNAYTDADWIRSIRHGVRADGKSLLVMPTEEFSKIGREDLQALIAYLKSVPPEDNELPPNELKLLGRLMITLTTDFNIFSASKIDHNIALSEVPEKAITLEFGTYMVQTCKGCHGEDLHGQPLGGTNGVSSTNIMALDEWSAEDFGRAVREGLRPNGDSLLVNMPRWSMLDELEINAIWFYIQEQKKLNEGVGSAAL